MGAPRRRFYIVVPGGSVWAPAKKGGFLFEDVAEQVQPSISDAEEVRLSKSKALMEGWCHPDLKHKFIESAADFPQFNSKREVYETHAQLMRHTCAKTNLGGVAGFKMDGIGVLGEKCWYAPFFRKYLLPVFGKCQQQDMIAKRECNPVRLEAKLGFLFAAPLIPRKKFAKNFYDPGKLFNFIKSVALVIEVCGSRATADVAAQLGALQNFGDLCGGGIILTGPRMDKLQIVVKKDRNQLINVSRHVKVPPGWEGLVFNQRLAALPVSLSVNGKCVDTGFGRDTWPGAHGPMRHPHAVTGPLDAVSWLANELNDTGQQIDRNQWILTPPICSTTAFSYGDRISATFGSHGSSMFGTTKFTLDAPKPRNLEKREKRKKAEDEEPYELDFEPAGSRADAKLRGPRGAPSM